MLGISWAMGTGWHRIFAKMCLVGRGSGVRVDPECRDRRVGNGSGVRVDPCRCRLCAVGTMSCFDEEGTGYSPKCGLFVSGS